MTSMEWDNEKDYEERLDEASWDTILTPTAL